MTPATETAMPATARTAVSLSSCSRRTASSQATPPPPSRPTTTWTSQGSSSTTPTSRRVTPAVIRASTRVPPFSGSPSSSGRSMSRPTAGGRSRHQSRRCRSPPRRTTPSGSIITRLSAERVTRTAAVGTASATSTTSAGTGRRSAGKKSYPAGRRSPTRWRDERKSTAPTTIPSRVPARVSPAAIRRVVAPSAPTRRIAASWRSRLSLPNRTAVVTKIMTGSSRTTSPRMASTSRAGGSPPGSPKSCPPNLSIRATP